MTDRRVRVLTAVPSVVGVSLLAVAPVTAALDNRLDGTGWQPPVRVDAAFSVVSCTSKDFCVAVTEDGNGLSYDGRQWSDPVPIDPGAFMQGLSCPTSSFCVAVDRTGSAVLFDGQAWSDPVVIDAGTRLMTGVSCASPRLCVAVDYDGNDIVFDGTQWTKEHDAGL